MNFYQELEARGLIQDVSNPEIKELLNTKKISFYIGYDPTAKSLQIGNLFAIITMKRFQIAGHKPYVLLGGATGMIGDPSGKSTERVLLTEEVIKENIEAQKKQFQRILKFDGENPAVMVNNFDWMGQFSFIGFLRDVGKRFRITEMLAKESVKNRIESEVGLSFTEFCYQMLQAYDFRHLALHNDVILQMGGGDQWGNITAGIDYTRKMDSRQVYGIVIPLVTDANGNKFGKSEGGENIWLDKKRTSSYKFYQFWLNQADADAERYIKIYTFLEKEAIDDLIERHRQEPHLRELQRKLATEITILVHGVDELRKAEKASQVLFGKSTSEDLKELDGDTFLSVFEGVPQATVAKADIEAGLDIVSSLADKSGFLKSNSEARRELKANSISVNKEKIGEDFVLTTENLIADKYVLLQKGKKNYFILIVE